MLRNYLLIAWRNLWKNKVFSLINLLGLAVGMAACVLILQYVRFERSYDDFHQHAADLYRISARSEAGAARQTPLTPHRLGPALKAEVPEVVRATRLVLPWSGQATTSTLSWENAAGTLVKQNFRWGFYTDPDFLAMFSFAWRQGDRREALNGPNRIVLSERTARKLFGHDWADHASILGQTVEYLNEFDRFPLVITGVIADAPENSHFQYDFLASFSTLSTGWAKDFLGTWEGNGTYTYLQLAPSAEAATVLPKLQHYFDTHAPQAQQGSLVFGLQPVTDIHLHSHLEDELKNNGNATYVSFLTLIAGLILLVALLNYVSLATAKAVARGKEVGVRKVMGAQRSQLVRQFLWEAVLLNGLAFLLALTLLQVAPSLYTALTGQGLPYPTFAWRWLVLLFPVSTLLSGFYPAFVLSGYRPSQVLKGKFTHSLQGKRLRQGMVVFQFWVAIFLLIFTFAASRQLAFMRSSDPGFDPEGVLVVNGPGNRQETWIEYDRRKPDRTAPDPFKEALTQTAGVKASSLTWTVPGERTSASRVVLGEAYHHSTLDILTVDSDYAEVYGLHTVAGRFDTDHGYVLNERAATLLGYAHPDQAIGQVFRDDRNLTYTITGVVKDYHHLGLQHPIRPILFTQNDPSYTLDSYYSLKVTAHDLPATLAQIRAAYEKVYPYEQFTYSFLDTYFDAQYQEDRQLGTLFSLFSGITMLIACLGLLGLSLHIVVEKTKEIGVRKVLGASVRQIVGLLSQEFVRLVGLASLVALPLVYLVLQEWLSHYATRIPLEGGLFFVPLGAVVLLALMTVSFQTIRAALANPIEALRSE
ncbi:putative ABC transport system permease protein [Catalinimonas alkaloidigena]|uniref:Putative ABC transport system permease protein n=1 Tax=Catalinimonas alkaloidigena TaxID=1075417 RepID=A0A1G9VKK8_9BACT|nr:ABC transporter permease [Catalinimonas alkaloidigena]SDM72603.1 putative ABC transport system permease protein [Catalinimonas alkaloidigena]